MRSLPDYDWCADDPERLAVRAPSGQPEIPVLIVETEDCPFPQVGTAADGASEPLVLVADPQVRTVGAYWHTGWPFSVPGTWLRSGAADRVVRAANALPPGFGLAIWDGWRDPALQSELHAVAYSDPNLEPGFVNPPSSNPATPPPHATGGTVDLTLTWHGRPLALGTGFDDFVATAHTRSFEDAGSSVSRGRIRDLRRLLRTAMVGVGFVQLECEWWHFEYGTRLWAAVCREQPRYPAAARPSLS